MAKRIRVLFAVGSMGGGGSERQLIGILRHLDRTLFEPLLYLVYREGELLNEIPEDVKVISFWDNHKLPSVRIPGQIHRWQVKDFECVLRNERIDVIYDRTYLMTMIAAPASRRLGIPRISVIDCEPQRDFAETAGQFMWIKRRLVRRAYLEADHIVAVSEGVRTRTIDYYRIPPEAVQTVYNFIDLDRIDRLAAEGDGPRDESVFRVICAGRLHEQKGYPHLINAMEDLVRHRGRTTLRLDILGQGDEEEKLLRMVRTKELGEIVQFHGYQANPYRMFRQSNLFCLPSLYEGLPTVLLDAMACRIPVLSTDCESGPNEILAGGKYGQLVPTGNSHALADAIEDAMENYGVWVARTELAREFVEQTFSPAVGIARVEELLKSVCNA